MASSSSSVPLLDPAQLGELRRFNSPTISNAVETFDIRPRGEGFTDSRLLCCFPEFGPLVGYACTALICSAHPGGKGRAKRPDYWRATLAQPAPRLTVIEDISDPPRGAFWGEVNSNIHLALGSQGVITNGTVRDLDEVRPLGFHFFAGGVSVSHAYAHLEDFNCPVTVFGMRVHPGDLIHADKHGAVVIPHEIAARVAEASRAVEAAERPVINLCKSPDFSIDALAKLVDPAY